LSSRRASAPEDAGLASDDAGVVSDDAGSYDGGLESDGGNVTPTECLETANPEVYPRTDCTVGATNCRAPFEFCLGPNGETEGTGEVIIGKCCSGEITDDGCCTCAGGPPCGGGDLCCVLPERFREPGDPGTLGCYHKTECYPIDDPW
jgi:hypothetical protein